MRPDDYETSRELERLRERNRHVETQLEEKKRELGNTQDILIQKERELRRIQEELNNLYRQFDVNQERLKQAQEALSEKEKKATRKSTTSRLLTILTSLLLLLGSVLAGIGTNLLTSNSSNSLGIALIVLAVLTYAIGTVISVLTIEGSS